MTSWIERETGEASLEEWEALTQNWEEKWRIWPSLFLLNGPLGVGKTLWVKIWLERKGFEGVTSPTYGLHHIYEREGVRVHHFDFYRIREKWELGSIGFWDVLLDLRAMIFVEWPFPWIDPHDGGFSRRLFCLHLNFAAQRRSFQLQEWM